MNDLARIPCVMMRGGTSRGPFFLNAHLPTDPAQRDALLISVMGSGHPLEIDGIGGGHALTSKVAIVGPSTVPDADVDYLFAQVNVLKPSVDTSPNCGNMLSAVGPFAIEAGLVAPTDPVTVIKIYNVNTGEIIEAEIPTPGGRVAYMGETRIDGVPGSAAPIRLTFVEALDVTSRALFPTGNEIETIEGIPVSCINCVMPMILVGAGDMGISGTESPAELNADIPFRNKLQSLRLEAGRRMGLGDVSDLVIPKPVILAPAADGGDLLVRYFMPHECHPSLATTGAVGIAAAMTVSTTIAARIAGARRLPVELALEHPSGVMRLGLSSRGDQIAISLIRTARRLFEGQVLYKPQTPTMRAPGAAPETIKETSGHKGSEIIACGS